MCKVSGEFSVSGFGMWWVEHDGAVLEIYFKGKVTDFCCVENRLGV